MNERFLPILVLFFALLFLITQVEASEPSIYDLSNTITRAKGSVSMGSEVVTLVSEKKVSLTQDISLHHRCLLYEDRLDERSSHNFDDILIKKSNDVVYKYDFGNNPRYRIIRLQKDEVLLILIGGYQHDGRIEVFHVQDGILERINQYRHENVEFADMDHDGIDEMLIADHHGYLLPKGALCNSVSLWIVTKYDRNRFRYSPKLTRRKYQNHLKIANQECDLEDRDRVEACMEVMEYIILNSHFGDIDSAAKAIRRNMIFRDKNEKKTFVDEYASWFFETQFIDEIKAHTGIQSPDELAADLLAKTGDHGN
jgi:hypothetical protein